MFFIIKYNYIENNVSNSHAITLIRYFDQSLFYSVVTIVAITTL